MTILCATDFSPSSQAALDVAAGLARRLGDSLLLLHVVEPYLIGYPEAAGELALRQQATHGFASTELQTVAQRLGKAGVSVESRVVSGSASTVILRTASEMEVRFIVLGTHGRRGLAGLILGSVASRVVRCASCPVVVTQEPAPGAAPAARWSGDEPLRLVLGHDGTPASEAALAWTALLSPELSREVTLVRLSWPPQEAIRQDLPEPWLGQEAHPDVVLALERDLRRQLESLPLLAVNNVRFRSAHVDASEVLSDEARGLDADAIVVAVPRRGLQAWNALVPADLLRFARVPVICVPEASAPPARTVPRITSVLIATDLSDLSDRAVPFAYGLLRGGGGRVELCHVIEREEHENTNAGPPTGPALDAAETARLHKRMRALAPPDAEARGITTNISVLQGSAVAAILAASLRLDVDIVALASHGRSGLKRAVLGSVAESVARQSTRPVLIVHVREPLLPHQQKAAS